jgi:hypothetical protein
MQKPNNGVLDSFLTPEAMLTPGAAGALTMMITNALGVSFAAPRGLTALVLSFVFGLLVLVADKTLLVKGIFYILNSLVIFCVASGANGIGVSQQRVSVNIVSTAFAETSDATPDDPQKLYQKLSEEYDALSKQIEDAKTRSVSKDDVLQLVAKRDEVQQKRAEVFAKMLKSQTGISIDDVKNKGVLGGENSEVKKLFFSPWRLRF